MNATTSTDFTSPSNAVNPLSAADDTEVIKRVEETLQELSALEDLLASCEADNFVVDDLEYLLPPGFLLTVVMPVFNEEVTLKTIVSRVLKLPLPIELVIVDDYSTDTTRNILVDLEKCEGVTVCYHEENRGKGAALRTGFAAATGDVVIVQDADLEYDPRDIPRLIRPLVQKQVDVVYGSRFLAEEHQDPSWLHRFGNGLLTKASNLLTGLHLTDMETCYKAFRRDLIQSIEIQQNRFGFEPEVTAKIAKQKQRIIEMPIRYNARSYDEGKKIGFRDAVNAFYCIVRYSFS